MKYIRSIALVLCLTLLLPLAACIDGQVDTDTTAVEDTTVTTPADTPVTTLSETEAAAPPPPLPTLADLQAGYTYDWDPNGYTMEFEDEHGQFRVQAVDEIWVDHLLKYRDVMKDHADFGEYVLFLPESGLAALPELSAETDPSFFEVGNTFELTFTTLTYNTNMKMELAAYTENGWRIVEELYPARGTTPMTVTYTVAKGDCGIAIIWLTGVEPMYIGNMKVTLTKPEDTAR